MEIKQQQLDQLKGLLGSVKYKSLDEFVEEDDSILLEFINQEKAEEESSLKYLGQDKWQYYSHIWPSGKLDILAPRNSLKVKRTLLSNILSGDKKYQEKSGETAPKADGFVQAFKAKLNERINLARLALQAVDIESLFYAGIVHYAREISSSKNIDAKRLVQTREGRAEIYKKIMPDSNSLKTLYNVLIEEAFAHEKWNREMFGSVFHAPEMGAQPKNMIGKLAFGLMKKASTAILTKTEEIGRKQALFSEGSKKFYEGKADGIYQ